MAQYGLPISDNLLGTEPPSECAGNSNGQAWDELSEGFGAGRGSGSGPDGATTYWRQDGTLTTGRIRCNLTTSLSDPVSSSGHLVRIQAAKGAAGACTFSATGQQIDYQIILYQGASTIIANRAIATAVTGTMTTYTYTLLSSEADIITDYTTLSLLAYPIEVGGGSAREGRLSAMELEIPNAPGGALPFPPLFRRRTLAVRV